MSSTNNETPLRVIDIVDGTIVDGPGLRTSIYFAGCKHQCPGCHNPQSWDMDGGSQMQVAEIVEHIIENDFNVTFTGGDPLYQMPALLPLCREIRALGKSIWCYTGFTYEEIAANPVLSPILDAVDVIVDGPFIMAQRDISLQFRGSANQRIIDTTKSNPNNIIFWNSQP